MNENPYQSPEAISEAAESSLTSVGGSWIEFAKLLLALGLHLLFRLCGVAFAALILLIYMKGTPINWPNVQAILTGIALGCLLTHDFPVSSNSRWLKLATGPRLYLAGIALAGLVFATGWYPAAI